MPEATLPISRIVVGPRHRCDLGDISSLAGSIRDLGLLQPVGVDAENRLIFGQRRLEACRSLGWETIAVRIVDAPAILAEHDENEIRKDFTPSERVAIGKEVETFLAGRRGSNQYTRKQLQEHFPEAQFGLQTRDIAAKAAGFGNGKTYQQAKAVVAHGAPGLIQAMDEGAISISAAATIAKLPEEEQQTIVAAGNDAIVSRARQEREKTTAKNTGEMGGGIKTALTGFTGNNEWYTPAKWIELARAVMGSIDIDPASSATAQQTVNAAIWFDQERDGLKQPWNGNVWLNPPYARGLIEQFIGRLVEQFNTGAVRQAVVLVDNRTDTRWFHNLCTVASAVAFTRGRVNFYNQEVEASSPANGSVFVYLGRNVEAFAHSFAPDCLVLFTSALGQG